MKSRSETVETRLEATCDFCGVEYSKTVPHRIEADGWWPPDWKVLSPHRTVGDDQPVELDCCPVCWQKLMARTPIAMTYETMRG